MTSALLPTNFRNQICSSFFSFLNQITGRWWGRGGGGGGGSQTNYLSIIVKNNHGSRIQSFREHGKRETLSMQTEKSIVKSDTDNMWHKRRQRRSLCIERVTTRMRAGLVHVRVPRFYSGELSSQGQSQCLQQNKNKQTTKLKGGGGGGGGMEKKLTLTTKTSPTAIFLPRRVQSYGEVGEGRGRRPLWQIFSSQRREHTDSIMPSDNEPRNKRKMRGRRRDATVLSLPRARRGGPCYSKGRAQGQKNGHAAATMTRASEHASEHTDRRRHCERRVVEESRVSSSEGDDGKDSRRQRQLLVRKHSRSRRQRLRRPPYTTMYKPGFCLTWKRWW